jgi:hypothetical protein
LGALELVSRPNGLLARSLVARRLAHALGARPQGFGTRSPAQRVN